MRFIVLLCIYFLISGCTSSSVQIGEFCIPKSNQYEIDDVGSIREIRTREGKMIPTCDTTIKMAGSQYGIGAAWFSGVTLEEAKRYFDEHAFSEESLLDDHFNVQMQEPGSIDAGGQRGRGMLSHFGATSATSMLAVMCGDTAMQSR